MSWVRELEVFQMKETGERWVHAWHWDDAYEGVLISDTTYHPTKSSIRRLSRLACSPQGRGLKVEANITDAVMKIRLYNQK